MRGAPNLNDFFVEVRRRRAMIGGGVVGVDPLSKFMFSVTSDTDGTFTLPLTSADTYNMTVDWGDGNKDTITAYDDAAVTHTYAQASTGYDIEIYGDDVGIFRFNNGGDKLLMGEVTQWGDMGDAYVGAGANGSAGFHGCANMTCTATDDIILPSTASNFFNTCAALDLDTCTVTITSACTTVFAAFQAMDALTDIGGAASWDMSNMTNISQIFYDSEQVSVDASSWDVGSVTNMAFSFYDAEAMNPDIGSWDVSACKSFANAFMNGIFNQDLSDWDTSAATNTSGMFYSASSFTNGGVAMDTVGNKWNVSSVKYMASMFRSSGFNQDISSWDVSSVTSMGSMFHSSSFNQDISGWNLGACTVTSRMFYANTAFNQDISGWDMADVTDARDMFHGASAFNQNISGWDVGSCVYMQNMFKSATSFDQDLGGWDIASMLNAASMFDGVTLSTANYDALLIGWDANAHNNNITFDGGNSKYTGGGAAATARANLVADGWTITDGGVA